MTFETLSARHALVAGLFALVPLAWYGLEGSVTAGVVSIINVLFILSCLYVAFTPVDGHDGHAAADAA